MNDWCPSTGQTDHCTCISVYFEVHWALWSTTQTLKQVVSPPTCYITLGFIFSFQFLHAYNYIHDALYNSNYASITWILCPFVNLMIICFLISINEFILMQWSKIPVTLNYNGPIEWYRLVKKSRTRTWALMKRLPTTKSYQSYLRNEFNSYPSYTSVTWVKAVYALQTAKPFIKKRLLFQPM